MNNATDTNKSVLYRRHVENVYFVTLLGLEADGDWCLPGVADYSSKWNFNTDPTVKIAQSNVITNKPTNEGDGPFKGSPFKHLSEGTREKS